LEGQFRRRSSKFKSKYAGARAGAESSFGANMTMEEEEEEEEEEDNEKQEEEKKVPNEFEL
jgi:hypothetical protein